MPTGDPVGRSMSENFTEYLKKYSTALAEIAECLGGSHLPQLENIAHRTPCNSFEGSTPPVTHRPVRNGSDWRHNCVDFASNKFEPPGCEVVFQPLHGPGLASDWREGPSCLVKREDIMEGEEI